MMECEEDRINWIWDKCIDIDDNYNPGEGFKKLNQLLTERKKGQDQAEAYIFIDTGRCRPFAITNSVF